MGLDTKTYWLTDRQSQCDFDFDLTEYDRWQTEVRSEVFILCDIVTVTFRLLALFVGAKCCSYSKIVLQLIVVPSGEYPIYRFI
jgi:hypothetical protein